MEVRRIAIGAGALSDRKFRTIWLFLLDGGSYNGGLTACLGPRYLNTTNR